MWKASGFWLVAIASFITISNCYTTNTELQLSVNNQHLTGPLSAVPADFLASSTLIFDDDLDVAIPAIESITQ